jgi:hypothetical protein
MKYNKGDEEQKTIKKVRDVINGDDKGDSPDEHEMPKHEEMAKKKKGRME